jgi:AraC-like DNA-binding protein
MTERIEFWRPPGIPGMEVLLAERVARRWRVFHETYSICTGFDSQGREFEWTYRRERHRAKDRGLMLMEPGEVHANTRITPPCTFRVLFIQPALVEQAARELGRGLRQPHLSVAHATNPLLIASFARFHAAVETASSLLEQQTRAAECLRLLVQHCTERGAPPLAQPARAAFLRAREYIAEHYLQPISLDELAAVSRVSRHHLVHGYARQFGLPPHAYQIQLQLTRARALIVAGERLSVVAAETGFADQSHFGRHFRKVYGVSPGKYAQIRAA